MLEKNPRAAGLLLQTGFSHIHTIISKAEYWTLVPLLWRLSPLQEQISWANRAPEVTRLLVDYIAQASRVIHGPEHPFPEIFQGFARMFYRADPQSTLIAMETFWRSVRDVLEAQAGLTSLEFCLAFTWHGNADAQLVESDPLQRLERIGRVWRSQLARIRTLENDERGRLQAHLLTFELTNLLVAQGRLAEAIELFESSFRTRTADFDPALRQLSYRRLAGLYEQAGHAANAHAILLESRKDAVQGLNDGTDLESYKRESIDMFLASVISSLSGPENDLAKVTASVRVTPGPTRSPLHHGKASDKDRSDMGSAEA